MYKKYKNQCKVNLYPFKIFFHRVLSATITYMFEIIQDVYIYYIGNRIRFILYRRMVQPLECLYSVSNPAKLILYYNFIINKN